MNLIARVTGVAESPRGEEESIAVQFAMVSGDEEINADRSQLVLVLPRVLGMRYKVGENFHLELKGAH